MLQISLMSTDTSTASRRCRLQRSTNKFDSCLSMAAAQRATVSGDPKTSEKRDYDPELDFFSDKFDALKALNTRGLKPPVLNAGIYDNISKYESEMRGKTAPAPKTAEPTTKTFERRFLPHQSKLVLSMIVIFKLW